MNDRYNAAIDVLEWLNNRDKLLYDQDETLHSLAIAYMDDQSLSTSNGEILKRKQNVVVKVEASYVRIWIDNPEFYMPDLQSMDGVMKCYEHPNGLLVDIDPRRDVQEMCSYIEAELRTLLHHTLSREDMGITINASFYLKIKTDNPNDHIQKIKSVKGITGCYLLKPGCLFANINPLFDVQEVARDVEAVISEAKR